MDRQNSKIKELEEKILKLQSSVEELKVLNDIAVSSSKTTDIDQILNLIVQKSIAAVQAEQGTVLLITQNKDKPFTTIVRQDDSSTLKHEYHIGMNITGWVLSNKKSLIIEDLSADERFKPSEEEIKNIHSVLCVPIWFEGGIIGLMMFINKKNQRFFTNNDLTLLSIISVQAGQLIRNLELQRESFLKKKESEKLQELDKIKTDFFTNVSHEFRTPLTLIMGPARQIFEQSDNKKIKDKAGVIFRNASKLNNLANQILDLARIEAGRMKLKTSPQNLILIIKRIVSTFQYLAETKKIKLSFSPDNDDLILYLDRDKIEKILSNLLSNAIKFTSPDGSIDIEIRTRSLFNTGFKNGEEHLEYAEILVSDSGIGIPQNHLNNIFDKFYQVETEFSKGFEGTGIGLALTRELVELHKGEISVKSMVGKGSVFKILLPKGKNHLLPEEIDEENSGEVYYPNENELLEDILLAGEEKEPEPEEKIKSAGFSPGSLNRKRKPILLIIEDNYEVRKYIIDILDNYYNIKEAFDGISGLSKAFEIIPHLIISDIMMPKMDGIQLCQKLKSDTRTSHIPLILLTARNAVTDKLEGLKTGADDYIMKPFEAAELKARIKNLLEQRQRIHKHFQQMGYFIDHVSVNSTDQKFLQGVFSTINNYLSDENFGVKKLAEDMAVSRSLLHKKLISLVGESPSDLIKRIRLNKAAKLIEQKTGNISEIAYEVGFSNPSYFAKCFQIQFGFGPSQYHTNYKNT
jgi:signal transduction histidine kinase/DNA-binding response OmpR family regulator